MKSYLSIPGINSAPFGMPCFAFDKLDGSNIRAEWNRKKGWHRFGTRTQLLDETNKEFGSAISVFLEKYGDAIPKVLRDEKDYRSVNECIAFCEFVGEHSFAGFHDYEEPHDVVLIDINPYKKGIIGPKLFIKHFGHLHIPDVVYEGNFNKQFVKDVREGKYSVKEGVVAKGNDPNGKYPHNLWMVKCKTLVWLEELRRKAEIIEKYRTVFAENEKEQNDE